MNDGKTEKEYYVELFKEHAHLLDKYDLQEAAQKLVRKLIEKHTGFYVGNGNGDYHFNLFNFDRTVEWNTARFDHFVKVNFKGDLPKLQYLNRNLYFFQDAPTLTKGHTFNYSGSMERLLNFLLEIIEKEPQEDYRRANAMIEVLKVKDTVKIGEYNVGFKTFVTNNRLDIKGLPDNVIADIVARVEEYRTMSPERMKRPKDTHSPWPA